MKQATIFLFLIFSGSVVNAQFLGRQPVYSSAELSFGNFVGIDISLNYLLKGEYTFKLGYSGNIRPAASRPVDYSAGMKGVLFYGFENPYDVLQNLHAGAGKIVNLNNKGTIRANLSLGFGYTTIKGPTNWEKNENVFLSETYNWNYKKYHTVSLIFNPRIEFPFTRFYGLSLSPVLQVNKDQIFFGIGIGQMLGYLRS